MANPCLKLIKGNNALETHFAGIEKLPIEQQREAILNKAKEYHEILYNELEALKITINPNHKVIKFSPDGIVGKNAQQDRPGSGNNNLPERNSGETQTTSGEQGVKPISQLGTGSNVYFEENGIRVNDSGNGVIMNVQSKEDFGGMANWNIPFENSKQAVQIAKQLSEIYPQGVPRALLLQKVVEDMVNPKAGERKEEKPKLTESEQVARQHKGIIYKNPKDGYYYEVTGYNSGYYTLKDLETGKVIKEKEEIFEKDFIDVTYEIGQQNKGIQSESSGVQNSTNYDVTQYQDNVFEVKEYGRNDAPTYKVVVGKAFDLDNSEVTKNGKPLAKNEKVPQDVLLAIQSHVDKFNPESKQREIKKFLNEKPKAKEQQSEKDKATVQKWKDSYNELKSKNDLQGIQNLYDKLLVALNGITNNAELKDLKTEIENYAKEETPTPEPKQTK